MITLTDLPNDTIQLLIALSLIFKSHFSLKERIEVLKTRLDCYEKRHKITDSDSD